MTALAGLLAACARPDRTAVATEPTRRPSPTSPPSTSGAPTATAPAPPTETPTPSPAPQAGFRLGEPVDLVSGQSATLEGTSIQVELIEAHGPGPGCYDCPNNARLEVRSGDQTIELGWSISGNMSSDALKAARRKSAFGFVFIAERIAEGSFTLSVEPDDP